jgi:hypothetical protein
MNPAANFIASKAQEIFAGKVQRVGEDVTASGISNAVGFD